MKPTRNHFRIATSSARFSLPLALSAMLAPVAHAQTSFADPAASTAWNAARWNNSADSSPYSSNYTANNPVNFTSGTYTFTNGIGAGTISVGNVTLADNVTVDFTGTIAGTYSSNAVRTINVGTNSTYNMATQVVGGAGYIKSGAGTWITAGGVYDGGFTLNAGTVALSGNDGMGSGFFGHALTINGGTIRSSDTTSRNLSGRFPGGITIGGNFTLGDVTNNGSLSFSNNVALGSDSRTITVNSAVTINSIISGGSGVGLTKSGSGNLTLQAINTYSGGTTITGGTLILGDATNTLANTGAVNVDGGTLALGINSDSVGAVTLTSGSITGSSGILTGTSYDVRSGNVSAILGGSGVALNKTTSGTVTLSASNTYNGLTTVTAGTLILGHASNTLVGDINVNGGTLNVDNPDAVGAVTLTSGTISGDSVLTGTSYTVESGTVSTGLGGSAVALTKNTTGTVTLSANNSFTGATAVNAGILNIQHATALGTTAGGTSVASGAALEIQGAITVGAEALSLTGTGISSGGALRNISGNNTYGGALTLTGATRINSDSGTLTLDVASGDAITAANHNLTVGGAGAITVADPIATGSGTLTKDGSGSLTLSATNTYTGDTLVSAGSLYVTGSLAGNVTVSDSATLGGGGTVQNVTFGGNSIFDILQALGGNPLDSSAISFAATGFGIDNLVSNGAPIDWGTVANGEYTLITGNLNETNLGNFGFANAVNIGGVRQAYFAEGSLQLVVIPEPSTALLGAVGMIALLRRRRN